LLKTKNNPKIPLIFLKNSENPQKNLKILKNPKIISKILDPSTILIIPSYLQN
jgi:hypothetical protein